MVTHEDFNCFEPLYEEVKNDPNEVYEAFYPKFLNKCGKISKATGHDYDELVQMSYMYFMIHYKVYDPFYYGDECKFIPFEAYIISNVEQSLRAYAQHVYNLDKRRIVHDYDVIDGDATTNSNLEMKAEASIYKRNELEGLDFNIDFKDYTKSIPKNVADILKMYMEGYTQVEIAKAKDTSQAMIVKWLQKIGASMVVDKDKLKFDNCDQFVKAGTFLDGYIDKEKYKNIRFQTIKVNLDATDTAYRSKVQNRIRNRDKQFHKKKDISDELIKNIITLRNKKYTQMEIVQELDCSIHLVRTVLRNVTYIDKFN